MSRLLTAGFLALLATVLLAGCSAQTQSPQSVSKTSATLRATLKWSDNEGPGRYWFEYRSLAAGNWTSWAQGSPHNFSNTGNHGCTSDSCSYSVTEAVATVTGRLYQYRLCGYLNSNTNAIACYDQNGDAKGENSSSGSYISFYADNRLYAESSPFNVQVSADPPLNPNSQAIVDRVTGQGLPAKPYAGAAGSSKDWSHPVYFAANSDPQYTIVQTGQNSGGLWNPEIQGDQIRIPADAQPAGGGDASFSVVQPDGWEYDFWDADAPSGGTLTASFGRKTPWNGNGLANGEQGGITAAGFANQLGVIRETEMESGAIEHALFMSVNGWYGRVYPSKLSGGTTGEVPDPESQCPCPAMGAHFWLNLANRQIDGLPIPDWQKVLLKAMHKYGMYVGGNTSGPPWAIQLESGDNYTSFGLEDPWIAYAKAQAIQGTYDTETGRTLYYFNFQHALDSVGGWSQHLKVLQPAQ